MDYSKLGFIQVAAVSSKVHLAKPLENAKEIIKSFKKLSKDNLIVLYPELSISGYSCEDLFHSDSLYLEVSKAVKLILSETKTINSLLVFGIPFLSENGALYNTALVSYKGKILGLVPKIHLPNYNEFYEKRWFTSGFNINKKEMFCGQEVLLSNDQLFKINDALVGIEICEDLWSPIPPSSYLALKGANVILNLSASNELIYKKEYRENLVKSQSARLNCAYVYSGANLLESTKDVVFSGHCIIAENGSLVKASSRFNIETTSIEAVIDLNKISNERRQNTTFTSSVSKENCLITRVENKQYKVNKLKKNIQKLLLFQVIIK